MDFAPPVGPEPTNRAVGPSKDGQMSRGVAGKIGIFDGWLENVLVIQRCCFVVEWRIMLLIECFLIQTCRNLKCWPNEITGE